ncbi:GTP-binding protein [Paenibacillus sp. KQZ6P-2]|uniref:GTP-binding protein n=2 Tax=Paenibacillus mangrovi TaxID=2931978 RepID=A0A9X1WS41_9BACL|nr:GTP-binding protein [Paenibacillus mangrovi]MCJ8010699.1 GTP-binding protein [Paenibacillus mangrovi]
MTTQKVTPIYILSGFLGSGKTTLLQRLVNYWQSQGLLPAVIMNEIGDVNLDGLLVEERVPMTEMLSGCICCSIRGDLSMEIAGLIQREAPDVIVVEATGIANPLEILDGVTEAALYIKIDLKGVITVVDSAHLLELYRNQKGKTFRLMQEQIRAASCLILNKTDRVDHDEQELLAGVISRWNAYAPVLSTVRCDVEIPDVLESLGNDSRLSAVLQASSQEEEEVGGNNPHAHQHSHEHGHTHTHHDHVMVYTHYLSGPVDSGEFESFIANLPREVYRAKGVLTFSDTASRFLFQYAFREPDFLRITPQGEVPDVVVFIGEHFSKSTLEQGMRALEKA